MVTRMCPLEVDTSASAEALAISKILNGEEYQSSLVRLSDLDRTGGERVVGSIATLDDVEKALVVLRLVDGANASVELNFNRVFRRLLDDPHAEVRRLALLGLWEDESNSLAEKYLDMLEHDIDADVRAQAAVALQDWCSDLTAESEIDKARLAKVGLLLSGIANDGEEPTIVRRRVIESLGALDAGPLTDEILLDALDDGDQAISAGAIRGMGLSGNSRWKHIVEGTLLNDDAEMRYEAAGAAGMIGDVDFVPELAKLMEDDDPEVQAAAALALGRIGGDSALRVLNAHVDAVDDPEIVLTAIEEAKLMDDPLAESL